MPFIIDENFEVLGYVTGFWSFIFSKTFRKIWLQDWRDGGVVNQFFMILGALWSIAFGVAIPAVVIYLIVR